MIGSRLRTRFLSIRRRQPTYCLPSLPGWGHVTPFVLRRSTQFEPNGPPRLSGKRYARDYNEVKAIGEKNSAIRTAEQTSIARFWYENSPAAWSRIAIVVAQSQGLNLWDTARLLALVNLAMADGFIAGFETKYDFNFWRPVTAIRAGDTDGNDATIADPNWSSLLNTPAIPDYTSTHSVLGGASSEVLRRFFHNDDVPFTTTSGVPFAGLTGRLRASPRRPQRTASPGFTPAFTSVPQWRTESNKVRRSATSCSRTLCNRSIKTTTRIAIG